jgi:hypothetical protein
MPERTPSTREVAFARAWAIFGGPTFRDQFYFDMTRQWRFDACWPAYQVAVEIHGGEFVRGRHNRPTGLRNDCEKMRAAQLQGWIVLPFVGSDLDKRPMQCCEEVMAALKLRGLT